MYDEFYEEGDFIAIYDRQKANTTISMKADIEEGIIVHVKLKRAGMLICEKEEPTENNVVRPFPPAYPIEVPHKIHNIDIGPIENEHRLKNLATEIYGDYQNSVQPSVEGSLDQKPLAHTAIYLAAQKLNLPLSLNEFEDTDTIATYARKMKKSGAVHTLPTPPKEFVKRFTDELSLDDEIRSQAIEYVNEYTSSRRPVTIAASAIYLASLLKGDGKGDGIKQKKLAQHVGVTPVSIRKCYEDMKEQLSVVL